MCRPPPRGGVMGKRRGTPITPLLPGPRACPLMTNSPSSSVASFLDATAWVAHGGDLCPPPPDSSSVLCVFTLSKTTLLFICSTNILPEPPGDRDPIQYGLVCWTPTVNGVHGHQLRARHWLSTYSRPAPQLKVLKVQVLNPCVLFCSPGVLGGPRFYKEGNYLFARSRSQPQNLRQPSREKKKKSRSKAQSPQGRVSSPL